MREDAKYKVTKWRSNNDDERLCQSSIMLVDSLNVAHPSQPRLLFRSVVYQNWAGHPERGFNLFLSCNHLVLVEQFVICHQINNTSGHLSFLKSQQLLFQLLLDLCTLLQGSSTCSMDPNEVLRNFYIHIIWSIINTLPTSIWQQFTLRHSTQARSDQMRSSGDLQRGKGERYLTQQSISWLPQPHHVLLFPRTHHKNQLCLW